MINKVLIKKLDNNHWKNKFKLIKTTFLMNKQLLLT